MSSAPDAASRREIVSAALVLSVAVALVGVVYGVGAVSAGASVLQTCAMSLLVFTGASQLSMVSAVSAGSTGFAALGGAALLAGRNTVYGLALSRVIGGSLGARLLAAQVTIDETTAMTMAHTDPVLRRYAFRVTGIAMYSCWNIASLVGALVGSGVDIKTWGLDVAFPAAYLAMLAPHVRTRTGLAAALLGAAICLILIPIAPAGVPVLGAATAVLVGLRAPAESEPEPAEVAV